MLVQFISKLNNSFRLNKSYVDIIVNSQVLAVLKLLVSRGIIQSFSKISNLDHNMYRIYLKVPNNEKLLRTHIIGGSDAFYNNNLKFIKKPCRSISLIKNINKFYYCSYLKLKKYYNVYHTTYIISTTQGLFFADDAINKKLGGKLIIIIKL